MTKIPPTTSEHMDDALALLKRTKKYLGELPAEWRKWVVGCLVEAVKDETDEK